MRAITPQFAGMLARGWPWEGVATAYTGAGRARETPASSCACRPSSRSVSGALERLERQRLDAPELGATPIVLVHGLSSSRTLKPLIRALGTPPAGLRARPARLRDERPADPSARRPGLADALRRWLFDNELAPAIVVGVSFGCQVAVDLAARHPAAVDRLVLVGPTFDPKARSAARLALRWARNAPRSSPRLAPTVVHDFIDAGPWRSVRTLRRALEDPIEDKLSRDRGADAGRPPGARPPRPGGLDGAGGGADPGRRAGRAAQGAPLDRSANGASRLTALLVALPRRDGRGGDRGSRPVELELRPRPDRVAPMEIQRHRAPIRIALHLPDGDDRHGSRSGSWSRRRASTTTSRAAASTGSRRCRPTTSTSSATSGPPSLGLAVLAALAAYWMDRRVIQAAAISPCSSAGLPHLAYHLTTTAHYSTGDNVASLFGLALDVAPAARHPLPGQRRRAAAVARGRAGAEPGS